MVDILFVQNYYEQTLGIMHISSMLKKHGYTTDVMIGAKEDVVNKIIREKPKVAGFYCTTGFHKKNIGVAQEAKQTLKDQTLTIFGGPHPTFVPDMINSEGVDLVCQGEGEYAVLELLNALRDGRDYTTIQNLIVKRNGEIVRNPIRSLSNLEEMPHPDRELYRNIPLIYHNKRQEVMISRGCPYDCTYCANHAYIELYEGKGKYVRFRSIPGVIEELQNIKSRYKPTSIFFHDDIFILKKDYTLDFLEAYKREINLPFGCLIRADLITEDSIRVLREKGCYFVCFGIESGDEELRKQVLEKRITDAQIVQCSDLLHKYEIPFTTFNMIGLPDETLGDSWKTVDLNIRVKPSYAWFSVYQPLPETKLAEYAIKQGLIETADVDVTDATFHESSTMIRKNPEGKKMLRLKETANLIVLFPFLKPLVRHLLIRLPFDAAFNLLDKFLYFILYYTKLTYKLGAWDIFSRAVSLTLRLKELK